MTRSTPVPRPSAPLPSPRPAGARRRLAATVAIEVGLLAILVWSAGRTPLAVTGGLTALPRRLASSPPLDAVALVAHRVALVLTVWLAAVTLGQLVVVLTRRPRALRISERLTPLAVRRLVAAAVVTAGTVAATGPWVPAGADPRSGVGPSLAGGHAPVVTVRDGRAAAGDEITTTGGTNDRDEIGSTRSSAADRSPASFTVTPGDSLWTLTRDALARETGRDPATVGSDEIAPRWLLVCEANRDRLRSGDVNVLEPGEDVVIPPG